MLNLSQNQVNVKAFQVGELSPGGEDRATVETDLSASPGPLGESSPHTAEPPQSHAGLNAINSPLSLSTNPVSSMSEDAVTGSSYFSSLPSRHISASDTQTPEQQAFDSVSDFRLRIARALVDAGKVKKAESFVQCGEIVSYMECESCGYRHTVRYNCKLRICPRCEAAKTQVLMDKWLPYLKSLDDFENVRHLTLTIKNVANLREGEKKLRDNFTRLRHRKKWKDRFIGGLYSLQTTLGNESGKWHIHLHTLFYGGYCPQDELSSDWYDLTGDSMIVDIRRPESPEKALEYIAEYICSGIKSDDRWDVDNLVEYVLALENVRLVQAYGCFLGHCAKERPVFECPKCGECFWRLYTLIDEDEYTIRSDVAYALGLYRNRSP